MHSESSNWTALAVVSCRCKPMDPHVLRGHKTIELGSENGQVRLADIRSTSEGQNTCVVNPTFLGWVLKTQT
jgi:hypothetical protein